MNLGDKLEKIADHYGMDIQLVKLAEECAEFSAAILKRQSLLTVSEEAHSEERKDHFLRKALCTHDSIHKELADVLVLAYQVRYLMTKKENFEEKITELMEQKADRQLRRIAKEPKENFND